MHGCFRFAKIGFAALLLSASAYAAESESAFELMGSDPDQVHGAADDTLDLRANTYIAVYYSTTYGNWGWGRSNNLETAKAIARGYCNENTCQYIFWTQNACAVLATGTNRSYGWAWNTNRLTAVQTALQNCSQYSTGCKVVVNECT